MSTQSYQQKKALALHCIDQYRQTLPGTLSESVEGEVFNMLWRSGKSDDWESEAYSYEALMADMVKLLIVPDNLDRISGIVRDKAADMLFSLLYFFQALNGNEYAKTQVVRMHTSEYLGGSAEGMADLDWLIEHYSPTLERAKGLLQTQRESPVVSIPQDA